MYRPDALVMQGSDARGHGHELGASIISLVPKICDALEAAGLTDSISVLAAGGIADGRASLAALILGAEGVVMGTAFLAASETHIDHAHRSLVLAAKDGGQATVRTRAFDQAFGMDDWPNIYDGRGLVNQSYLDYKNGFSKDEIYQRFRRSVRADDSRWSIVWAGSGVGMVKTEESATQMLEHIRTQMQNSIVRIEFMAVKSQSQGVSPLGELC